MRQRRRRDDDLIGERADEHRAEDAVADGDRRDAAGHLHDLTGELAAGDERNGAGIWYVFAITSTSGKFTAPTWTRTRAVFGVSSGAGTSAISTTSGPP